MRKTCFLIVYLIATMATTAVAKYHLFLTPYLPLQTPCAGHYAGCIDDELSVWGGLCQYKRVGKDSLEEAYRPNAYGCTVDMDDAFLCLGGRYIDGSSPYCMLLKSREEAEKEDVPNYVKRSGQQERPFLPFGLHRHSGIKAGNRIYVVGGMKDSAPNNQVLYIEWPDGKEWVVADTLPDRARLNPVLVPTSDGFLVMGGQESDTSHESNRNGYAFNTADNTHSPLTYDEVPDSLFPASRGCYAQLGRYCTLFVGGREGDGTYRSRLVVYNSLTDTWTAFEGDTLLARCDATLSPFHDGYLLSGGEVADGRFTDDVTLLQFLPDSRGHWINILIQLASYLMLLVAIPILAFKHERRLLSIFLTLCAGILIAAKYGLMMHYFAHHPEAFPFHTNSLFMAVESYPIISAAWVSLVLVPISAIVAFLYLIRLARLR